MKPAPPIDALVSFLDALADETRLRLVISLAADEKNVAALCNELGKAQPTVSHHLNLLRLHGIVESRRSGKRVIYSLTHARVRDGSIRFPNGVSIDVTKSAA